MFFVFFCFDVFFGVFKVFHVSFDICVSLVFWFGQVVLVFFLGASSAEAAKTFEEAIETGEPWKSRCFSSKS